MKEANSNSLSVSEILPGLILIVLVDLAALLGLSGRLRSFLGLWNLGALLLPWVTILVMRKSSVVLGYRRHRSLAAFGWGMLAGAVWRGLSLAFNLWLEGGWTQIAWTNLGWFAAVLWIPFVEETFFRGYLGRAFTNRLGVWPGIGLQTLLFSFHPGHVSQGWPHLFSILAFGLLAGWLMERHQSIWAPWGAHAFANILPELVRILNGSF